jgi:hypothetical protein
MRKIHAPSTAWFTVGVDQSSERDEEQGNQKEEAVEGTADGPGRRRMMLLAHTQKAQKRTDERQQQSQNEAQTGTQEKFQRILPNG